MFKNIPTVKWFFVILTLQILILYIIFGIFIYPLQKEIIKDTEINKIKLLSDIYSKYIKTYLEKNDDISLLETLKEIANISEICCAQIIDLSGKIVAHNNIQKWTTDSRYFLDKNIISSESPVLQKSNNFSEYNYFIPIKLDNNKKFFFSISGKSEKMTKDIKKIRKRIILYAGFLFLSGILLSIIFFYVIVLIPLNRTNTLINSLILGKPGEKIICNNTNLFSRTHSLINRLVDKYMNIEKNDNRSLFNKVSFILDSIGNIINYGIVIVDSKNIVLYINKKAKEILNISKENISGQHIIEIFKNKNEFIELYSDSLKNPNIIIEKFLQETNTNVKLKNIVIENDFNMVVFILEKISLNFST